MLTTIIAGLALAVSVLALWRVYSIPNRMELTRFKLELADALATWETLADRMTRNAKSAGARLGRALAEGGQAWDGDLDQLDLVEDERPNLDDFKRAKGVL